MDLLGIEWSVLVQRLEKKQFDACALGWTGTLKPDPYQLWHSSGANLTASSNHIGFVNKEADRLIEAFRVEFDVKKRIELAHQLQRLLHEEQPYTFLFSPDSLQTISARYRNVRQFPLGIPPEIIWTPLSQQLNIP